MPTILQIIQDKKRKQAGADADPLAEARSAGAPLQVIATPDPVLATTGPTPHLYSMTPKPAELPPPVAIVTEADALARLFPAIPGDTRSGNACHFRRDWMRLRIPSAADPQGGRFYALAALDVLAPHAGALMAAEMEAARETRRKRIGRIVEDAKAEGLSDADTMARVAAIDAK